MNVPLPPGAVEAGDWEMNPRTDRILRTFLGAPRGTKEVSVGIAGQQDFCSGEVLNPVALFVVDGRVGEVDLDGLVEHINNALVVADELRRLSGQGQILGE
ncbi:hypothetical protein A5674_27085 [Mycobacterium malmoense]|uniref:hypothetical protein n=1 Tax=Mycobacterium malmoense TaxID=1780 RepID=UPI00080B3542|nr:hypothetical protein [Mycobacterium malmoense]OCB21810.1 hypothetical protein A5674_27085 [Mycobacterium malmoense]